MNRSENYAPLELAENTRNELSFGDISLYDALLNCKTICNYFKTLHNHQWISSELNGYIVTGDESELKKVIPDYRFQRIMLNIEYTIFPITFPFIALEGTFPILIPIHEIIRIKKSGHLQTSDQNMIKLLYHIYRKNSKKEEFDQSNKYITFDSSCLNNIINELKQKIIDFLDNAIFQLQEKISKIDKMEKDSTDTSSKLHLPTRNQISKDSLVKIETKTNQGSNNLTEGIVQEILTPGDSHPHGIKVRLRDGQVGRVKSINDVMVKSLPPTTTQAFENLDEKIIPKIEDVANEFKEFYQHDPNMESQTKSNKNSKAIKEMMESAQKRIAIAVCSFGNSYTGGFLYIGIKSDGTISGLDADMKLGRFANYSDAFANHILDRMKHFLADRAFFSGKIKMKFREIKNKTICIIQILPSASPLYLRTSKEKAFYVRGSAPRAEKLDSEEQFKYIRERFPNYR